LWLGGTECWRSSQHSGAIAPAGEPKLTGVDENRTLRIAAGDVALGRKARLQGLKPVVPFASEVAFTARTGLPILECGSCKRGDGVIGLEYRREARLWKACS
jgi:hypothetical protein